MPEVITGTVALTGFSGFSFWKLCGIPYMMQYKKLNFMNTTKKSYIFCTIVKVFSVSLSKNLWKFCQQLFAWPIYSNHSTHYKVSKVELFLHLNIEAFGLVKLSWLISVKYVFQKTLIRDSFWPVNLYCFVCLQNTSIHQRLSKK